MRLGFVFNLLLVQRPELFFSESGFGSMMGVLWTLPVEMQMYLFLPVIFLFVQRVTSSCSCWLTGGSLIRDWRGTG